MTAKLITTILPINESTNKQFNKKPEDRDQGTVNSYQGTRQKSEGRRQKSEG